MNQTNYIPTTVDQILVPHKDFQSAKSRIETHLLAAQSYQEPTCLAVVGESRTGKSRLLENITKQYPKQRTDEGSIIPVLSIRTPSKPTVKALVEVMLKEIGDPLWFKRGSDNSKRNLYMEMIACPLCKKGVSPKAENCPNCNHPDPSGRQEKIRMRTRLFGGCIVFAVLFYGWFFVLPGLSNIFSK